MAYSDFEYDGQYLSDYGLMIAYVSGEGGLQVENAGSKIVFEKTPFHNGSKHYLHGAKYEECITISFEVCKNPDLYDSLEISNDEFRDLMRWLNRREYLSFSFVGECDDDELSHIYYGSFNVKKIVANNVLIGLSLTLETNSPFAEGQEQYVNWTVSETSKVFNLTDLNDNIGDSFPNVEILIQRTGDFQIYNQTTDTSTEIKNCTIGEKIIIDGQSEIITSDNDKHLLNRDFNFVFPIIRNTINNRINKLKFSLPCKVKISYKPKLR